MYVCVGTDAEHSVKTSICIQIAKYNKKIM